jgi:DNA recombination protein RmuC
LENELKNLRQLNEKLSKDAENLVNALKMDNKIQGNW